MGNSVDNQRGTLYDEPSSPRSRYRSTARPPEPPPPPAEPEVLTAPPAPNALWIPGYWSYDGYHYAWAGGHWEIPPPNARAYVTAHWEGRGGGYAFVPSYWR
jgi:WXXGXW repeat (2 copies)